MRFSENFQRVWWLILVIVAIIFVYFRWDKITSSESSIFDIGILAIFAALILVLLFSEISIFGMTVKQQIEDAKRETK